MNDDPVIGFALLASVWLKGSKTSPDLDPAACLERIRRRTLLANMLGYESFEQLLDHRLSHPVFYNSDQKFSWIQPATTIRQLLKRCDCDACAMRIIGYSFPEALVRQATRQLTRANIPG